VDIRTKGNKIAWLADPSQPEHVLKSRALLAAWGWDVKPEAFLRA
jgi:hypothetical protein